MHKNVAVEPDVPGLIDAEIQYARNGGVAIAYQVVGEGDVDLVYVPDFVSNLAGGGSIRRCATSTSVWPGRSG